MARGASTFRQRDVTRALKGARAAGIEVQRVEIDRDGKIVMIPGVPEKLAASTVNDWDEVLSDGSN